MGICTHINGKINCEVIFHYSDVTVNVSKSVPPVSAPLEINLLRQLAALYHVTWRLRQLVKNSRTGGKVQPVHFALVQSLLGPKTTGSRQDIQSLYRQYAKMYLKFNQWRHIVSEKHVSVVPGHVCSLARGRSGVRGYLA